MSNSTDSTLETGMVLNDKWVILELVGKGGMGEVYRAHQLNLKRDIALKVISQKLIQEIADNEYEAGTCIERFRREVQVMAQVRHPNVIHIFDCGSVSVRRGSEESPIEYIAMEYIPGASLRSTMSAEGFYPGEDRMREWLVVYFLPLLNGVQAFHELGTVHRDLKPENVLLDGTVPKIADFGLARSCRLKPVTQSMDMRGTPPYMSPEHFLDLKRTDQRTDVYALGKILYEAVSGKISPDEIPFKQAKLKNPETFFFQALDQIIQDATAENKNQRLPSVEAFRAALLAATEAVGKGPLPVPDVAVGKRRIWSRPVLVVTMLIVFGALISFGTMLIHKRGFVPEASQPVSLANTAQGKGSKTQAGSPSVKLQGTAATPTLQGEDYAIMRLVPGGKFTLPRDVGLDAGKAIEVSAFYIDETQVTNHQYIEFLNQVLPRLKVEKGLVHGDGQLWAILGQIMQGYEPIVFDGHKFYVNGTQHAACPVLRVTAYGASAYARFYGKRLPTEDEWLYAAMEGGKMPVEHPGDAGQASVVKNSEGFDKSHSLHQMPPSSSTDHMTMLHPTPVMFAKPDIFGILGLNGDFGEWADRSTDYVVLGRYWGELGKASDLPSAVHRYPWEAFEAVGFRCAVSIPSRS
jgi:eukaryotic-like serine/threonine-protein kinase